MFEPQDHPSDFAYPGAAPTAPYDIAGWTLAYQMAVQFDRILDGFEGPFEEMRLAVLRRPRASGWPNAVGLLARSADERFVPGRQSAAGRGPRSARGCAAILARAKIAPAGDVLHPVQFFHARRSWSASRSSSGTPVHRQPGPPAKATAMIKPVRVGLWDRYGGSMPSGWTRWLLERFEFPFQVVFPPELDKGGLRDEFDVLIFVDGAIPASTS